MTSQFFLTLVLFLTVPVVLSRVFRMDRVFPLVFLQLLFGLCIHMSGLDKWLQLRNVDLLSGPLSDSLSGLGWVGVSLLVALTGSESAPRQADRGAWRFFPISVIGFLSTCALGSLLGYCLASGSPELIGPKGGMLTFSLAIGLSLSVTAMPVLISILRETGLFNTELGNLATNCALLDDLWMWLGLALVLSLVAGGTSPLRMASNLSLYLLIMLGLIRPFLNYWLKSRQDMGSTDRMLLAVSIVFLSAVATNLIGLHGMFGTFVAGAILPRRIFDDWRKPLTELVHVLLLPFFFIFTGLRLEIKFDNPSFWTLTAMVTAVAILGKLFSVAFCARRTGLSWKEGFALGSLMQCKGLMELIAINILLETGIIGSQLFSALAMMALASTCFTAPALRFLLRESVWHRNLRGQEIEGAV